MHFIASAVTDVGLSKKTNQDSGCATIFQTQLGNVAMAVICDGMGGLSKGELASATVINDFRMWADKSLPILCSMQPNSWNVFDEWNLLISKCNEKIRNYGDMHGIKLGTTVAAIIITEEMYFAANVGDSRIYEIKDTINQLTEDQTVVAEEIRLGLLTVEEAKSDPRRSVLLQCVGASTYVEPDFFVGNTMSDCVYMLCSDGFRHELTSDEIFTYLNPSVMTDEQMMRSQSDYLIQINKSRCEQDNISVITVRSFD